MSESIDTYTKPVEVTIIMPAYNEEQSIGKTIRKIRQLHPDFEILVVDDGSNDNTKEEAVNAGANLWQTGSINRKTSLVC